MLRTNLIVGKFTMAWLVLCLIILIVIGHFIDFLIGERGERSIKNALVDFYVMVNTEEWFGIFRYSADMISRFIAHALGPNVFSGRYFLRLTLLSSIMTVSIVFGIFYVQRGTLVAYIIIFRSSYFSTLFSTVLANLLADFISWSAAKYLFGRLSRATPNLIAALMCASIAVGYFAFGIALLFSSAWLRLEFAWDLRDIEPFHPLPVLMAVSGVLIHPWNADVTVDGMNYRIFSLSVLLPQFLFMGTVLICYTIYAGRRFILAPLALILERLEGSRGGVFTLIASGLAATVGILTALREALK